MKHEKIFKRSDGTRYKIVVTFYDDIRTGVNYSVNVESCQPGKKTFADIQSKDDYKWRALSMTDRTAASMEKYLQHVTKDEILAAKLELWQKLKPAF